MKYLGGKHRLGKEISSILRFLCPDSYKNYLEPFCGALGVFRHMTDDYKCLGSDLQPDIIKLWNDIKNKKFTPPKSVDDKFYNIVKNHKSPSALRGFVGFLCSWNGMFFAGLAKYKGTTRDACKEATNDINKIKPLIQKKNVKFKCISYNSHNPKNTLIYCDPPYKGTIGYTGNKGGFNHDEFWNVMRKWSVNNLVIISEESAPKDFKCIWKKSYSRGRGFKSNKGGKNVVEKLFTHKKNYDKFYTKIKKIKSKYMDETKARKKTRKKTRRKSRKKRNNTR
jgi:DNA adenine methylase